MSNDVAIVGGSASGLYTALLLAQQGHKVRVYEAAERIAPQCRSLIVTKKAKELLGEPAEQATVHTIRNYELFTDGRVARISLKDPELVLERASLVENLASLAEDAGVEVLTGRKFQGLGSGGKGHRLEISDGDGNKQESAETLVGADGARSSVAKSVGLSQVSTLPLIQAIVELPQDQAPDTTRVWFLPEETPYFYWLIPHSRSHGVLGLIGTDWDQSRDSLERFIQRKSLAASGFQSAEVPVNKRWIPPRARIDSGNVYLVGDAAGQVKVTTVGGIVTGFKGALGVAETISKGRYSPELRSLRCELWLHRTIRRALHGFAPGDYSSLLDMLNPSVRHLLAVYTRDEAVRLLMRVLTRQPRLMTLGIRGLLKSRFSPGTGSSGS